MPHQMGNFKINERMMRYSNFVPRFYNLCKSYGFQPGRIMPSRAFCSDESQGFPIILIAKHFGTFPFNHGQVGGIVATDRHGPHAHHGKDLVILQASHVGYDPDSQTFGTYRRLQMEEQIMTTSCGKICGVLSWYQDEYAFAQENISFSRLGKYDAVIIDNQLLNQERTEGLYLHLHKLRAASSEEELQPIHIFSTAKAYPINLGLKERLPASIWQNAQKTKIGNYLSADLFYFKKGIREETEGSDHLEHNLSHSMPYIVTSEFPALVAAQANTQIEFDRTYRSILNEPEYQHKTLIFIAGLHIDISPREGQFFPLTKFVPWAAYVQTPDKNHFILEQDELMEALLKQSKENPDEIELDEAIGAMESLPEVSIDITNH